MKDLIDALNDQRNHVFAAIDGLVVVGSAKTAQSTSPWPLSILFAPTRGVGRLRLADRRRRAARCRDGVCSCRASGSAVRHPT